MFRVLTTIALGLVCWLAQAETTGQLRVKIITNVGDIVVSLNAEKAPITVANFLAYVDDDSFENTIFHRVIVGFMVQGGGHYLDLSEAPDKDPIRNEADNGLKNVRGSIAMARLNQIDSASRQFFINVKDNTTLDHNANSCSREDQAIAEEARAKGLYRPLTCRTFGYAVFGKVEQGMEIVYLIELSDTHSIDHFDDVPINPIIVMSMERMAAEN